MADRRATKTVLSLLMLACTVPTEATAQVISLRTVPVATGEQFSIYPSRNLGMGSVTVAVDDPWVDAFGNPALGLFLEESSFLASPTFYGIEGSSGAGRTVPLTGLFKGRTWFGGASVALQQIVNENGRPGFDVLPLRPGIAIDVAFPRRLDSSDATNTYASGFLGLRLSPSWAIGGGASVANLNAVDGVDLLYANSRSIDQNGSGWSVRAGVVGDLGEGKRIEAVVVHDRFSMDHDVSYLEWFWDATLVQMQPIERVEHNLDRTRTTGVQVGFTAPVGEGWRAGPVLTVNRKSHPKIPNYDLANVPRDPGDSWAFDIGAGLGHQKGPLSFGVDVIYQPAWSQTWAEAADTVRTEDGVLLQPGDHTVENDFFLSNLVLRLGLARESERWGFQLGVRASARETQLDQWDAVTATRRKQNESWMEWTPSLGATLRFPDVEVRYAGWITTGTGRPSVEFSLRAGSPRAAATASASDFLIPPSGPLILQEARVTTHQISVRLPLH